MGVFKESIRNLIDFGYQRGMDGEKIARRLIEAGFDMAINDGAVMEPNDTFYISIGKSGKYAMKPVLPIDPDVIQETLKLCAETFADYEMQHRAKGTPEGDAKAERNLRMKERCLTALGEPTDTAIPAPGTAQERDSEAPAPLGASKLSDAPMSRAEVLLFIDQRMAGYQKHGMDAEYAAFKAFRHEIAGHLEEQPVNMQQALKDFYVEVHKRNVKAGWWNDLATGQPKKRSVGELLVLMVTEIWEAFVAYEQNLADDKLPQYPGLGVEMGDLQIRLADFMGAMIEGSIVEYSGVDNPGERALRKIGEIAEDYEAIRKTPKAKGEDEAGELLPAMSAVQMIFDKLDFNANRPDHKIENRKKEGGKVT